LNTLNWGGGFARYLDLPNGTTDLLFAQVFDDSERMPQITIGAAKLWNANLSSDFDLSAGYSIGLTQRSDNAHGIPLPYVLPVASIRLFRQYQIYATYVPPLPKSTHISGNAAFIFSGLRF
jgi:palmitoyl transferase